MAKQNRPGLFAFIIALATTQAKISRRNRLDQARLNKTAIDIADKKLQMRERQARIDEIEARTEFNRIRNKVMQKALEAGNTSLLPDRVTDICPQCQTHYSRQLNKTRCDDCGTRLTQTVLEF
jgi:hypothetical protein